MRAAVPFSMRLIRLASAGVAVLESRLEALEMPDGSLVAYCIQPALDPGEILPRYLGQCPAAEAGRICDTILDRVARLVTPALGFDGQPSNWAVKGGEPCYLDVTTPLMRDAQGRERLNLDLFLASLPWALQGLVRRFLLGEILGKYYQPRGVALDFLGNLHKEGLARLLPDFLARANARFSPAISRDEVDRYYAGDARTWSLLQRLRRWDRAWQRRVRRRTYPFLLPGPIDRGRVSLV